MKIGRSVVTGLILVTFAALLAACGSGKGETGAQATAAPGGAATKAPTTAGASQAAGAPTAAAAGATPQPDLTIVSGKFNVWFSANWNTVTDEAV
ncbi:MAG: hypothetical protein JO314_10885, partial [Acidobacteria bacterium]|nr:hypothetical protein [Acidobacteriota bacterium]